MKVTAKFSYEDNGSCEFYDENGNLFYQSKLVLDSGNKRVFVVYDKNDKEISQISYSKREFIVNFLDEKLEMVLKETQKSDLVSEDQSIKIKDMLGYKWFKLYKNETCIMSTYSLTLVRDWLQSKYTLDFVGSDEDIVLVITLFVVRMILMYDKIVDTTRGYMGKF